MVLRDNLSYNCPPGRNICCKGNNYEQSVSDRCGQSRLRKLDFLAYCACKMFTDLSDDIQKPGKLCKTLNKDSGFKVKRIRYACGSTFHLNVFSL